jgi:hypothetical protein
LFIKEFSDEQQIGPTASLKMQPLTALFGQGFVNKAAAATERDGNLPNAPTFRAKDLQSSRVNGDRFAAYAKALGATIGDSGFHPLAYEVALKLGQ